jgi:hypothetical protein
MRDDRANILPSQSKRIGAEGDLPAQETTASPSENGMGIQFEKILVHHGEQRLIHVQSQALLPRQVLPNVGKRPNN